MSYCEYCSNSLADTETKSVSKKIVLRILFQESNFAIQQDIFEFSAKRNYKISCIILPTIAKKEISLGVPDDADQNIFFITDSICLKPHCSTQVKTNNTCSIRTCQMKLLDGWWIGSWSFIDNNHFNTIFLSCAQCFSKCGSKLINFYTWLLPQL